MKYKKYLLLIPICALAFLLARPLFAAKADPGRQSDKPPTTQTSEQTRSNVIADGVWVGSLNLSGKTFAEAATAVDRYLSDIKKTVLTLNVYNNYENREEPSVTDGQELLNSFTVPLKDLGLSLSTDDILRQASSFGQTGMLVERYKHLQDMRFDKVDLFPDYTIRQDAVRGFVTNTVCPEVNRGATDAQFTFTPPNVNITRRESPGVRIDVDKTVETILALFEDGIPEKPSCDASVTYEDPKITAESVSRMTSVLGEFSTTLWDMENYYNRTQNIILIMKILNGSVVMPGEVFSVWEKNGGDTTRAKGYLPATAFTPTGSVDEDGGGVCQASTTIYGALLRSELDIVERHPHSRVVGYVPYAQDAALYYPYKDLKFRNNTDSPVYLQTYVEGNQVVCRLYGHDTRQSGRKLNFVTPENEIEMNLYGPIYSFNRNANPGVPKVTGGSSYEVEAACYKEVIVGGKVVERTLVTKDHYNGLRRTVTIACNMYELHQREEVKGYPKLYNKDGNQLLVDKDGVPFYDGAGGYMLVKDYQADADGHAKLGSNGKPVLKAGAEVPTPTTAPATTEPATTAPAPTEPPTTEAPETWGEWVWGEWTVRTPATVEAEGVEFRTGTRTSSKGNTESQEETRPIPKLPPESSVVPTPQIMEGTKASAAEEAIRSINQNHDNYWGYWFTLDGKNNVPEGTDLNAYKVTSYTITGQDIMIVIAPVE